MDINATSILSYQLAMGQQNIGTAVMKSAIESEKAVATILENAVQSAAATNGRGSQLDITV